MQHDVQVRSLEGILKKLSLQCIVISLDCSAILKAKSLSF